MANNKQLNIKNSIVLTGPCGVGKSLIADTLSHKSNKPLLDIDDLILNTTGVFLGTLIFKLLNKYCCINWIFILK